MDRRIRQVISLMQNGPARGRPLCEMANAVNLSYSRLRHLFRNEIGMSPERYMKLLRMMKAKELLETTFLQVKEICAEVGVNDESHFVRDFKRIFGVSPMQYRARVCDDSPRPRPDPPIDSQIG
jgi:AraC family transcriptional regulator of arabinose operon